MRVAYADPPYPGQSEKHYADHPDYAGEVDHAELIERMERDYDGWLLHTSSVALRDILPLCPPEARVMGWMKSFAAYKVNIPVAYAWEPVIVKACRKPVVSHRVVSRDWMALTSEETTAWLGEPAVMEGITMRRGLSGVKPEKVCRWAFEMLGLEPTDELVDLFPGSGAVTRAWKAWQDDVLRDDSLNGTISLFGEAL